jgi:hypothetical protein
MGCGRSKGHHDEKKGLDFDMKPTKVPQLDEIFETAAAPLATLKEAYDTLHDAIAKFETQTHSKLLRDHTTEDGIMIMLYCFSASSNGDFAKLEYRISHDAPFIYVKKDSLEHQHWPITDAWWYFATEIAKIPSKLEPLEDDIKAIVDKAKGLKDSVPDAVSSSNLNVLDAPKALVNFGANLERLIKAPKLLTDTIALSKSTITSISNLTNKLTNEAELNRVHEIGHKAHKEKVMNVDLIIRKYWPDQSRVLGPTPAGPAKHH